MTTDRHDAHPERVHAVAALSGPQISPHVATELDGAGVQVAPLPAPMANDLPGDGEACPLLRAQIIALGTDVLVVEISARVGLDPATIDLWSRLRRAGLPAVVVISGLGPHGADFDDLVAIVHRTLDPQAAVVALPVFDDDEGVAGTWDVLERALYTPGARVDGEPVHHELSAQARLDLLETLAVHCSDETLASSLLDELAAGPLPGDLLAESRAHAAQVAEQLWQAVAEGDVTAIMPVGADGWWARAVAAIAARTTTTPRLVRRDQEGAVSDSPAAIVLHTEDDLALVRPVYGEVTVGPVAMTAPGCDETGQGVPYRSWPNELSAAATGTSARGAIWCRAVMRTDPGDTLAPQAVWLLPADLD